ncbi:MAG TPA: tetratricopeptide repeat protein [Thermoanaerobaculia bacterium]
MLELTSRIEDLRQTGLAKVRDGALEEALGYYDEALALTDDETARELITINKADALIALERNAPEVQELARVIMRRRNPRHVYLAAYALQYKHRLENNLKRALFYGELALRTAEEAEEPLWRRVVLLELGNLYTIDSQIAKAIECYEQALAIIGESEFHEADLSHGWALESLGYCIMLDGRTEEGIARIHDALLIINDRFGREEAFVDLCYGYLEMGNLDEARKYGEAALEIASEPRPVRNAHYLLGEVAYKLGDTEAADRHFDELARFYPEFTNLKSLLFAIDLRSMVNLKL